MSSGFLILLLVITMSRRILLLAITMSRLLTSQAANEQNHFAFFSGFTWLSSRIVCGHLAASSISS